MPGPGASPLLDGAPPVKEEEEEEVFEEEEPAADLEMWRPSNEEPDMFADTVDTSVFVAAPKEGAGAAGAKGLNDNFDDNEGYYTFQVRYRIHVYARTGWR